MTKPNEQFLSSLTEDLEPVKPVAKSSTRSATWLGLGAIIVLALALSSSVRPHLNEDLSNPRFLIELAAILVLLVATTLNAFKSSIPGVELGKFQRRAPGVIVIGWIALLVFLSFGELSELEMSSLFNMKCGLKLLMISVLPALSFFLMLRKAAPLKAGFTGLHAGLASAGIGLFSLHLMCPDDSALHLLLTHVLPALTVAVLAFIAAERILRR